MQTLPNGVVVPDGSDNISASGVGEIRALGASVDSVLAGKAEVTQVLTASDSLDDITDGWYRFDATGTPAALGIPVEGSQQWLLGEFHQFSVFGSGNYVAQEYRQLNGHIVRRVRDTGVWGDWEAGDGTLISTPPPSASHEMRVRAFKDAYPLVSTEGKGVVVLRFDHGLTTFKSTIWPLLQHHQVKAYIAMNSRLWGIAENAGASQADAQAWIASGLVEFGNHTADHVDRNTAGGIYDTIVNGRRELESQLGTVVHGFTVPGLSEFAQFEGFGAGSNASYSNTYAGGLILANHAIASGSVGYVNRTLDGQVRQGGRHFTWESASWTSIKAQIDQAVTNKTAITLMAHPREMGRGGYFDAALLGQVIGYIRERIDAGGLADISYYQSHHATTDPLVGGPADRVLGTADLDQVAAEGVHMQPFAANATEGRGYPIQSSGTLTVTTEPVSATTWQVWDADSGRGRWKRVLVSGAWSAWERADSTFRNRGLLGSRNLDTVTDDGVWHQIYSSGATTALNYPITTSGVLTMTTVSNKVYQWYSADADRGEFRRVKTAEVWGPWSRTSSTIKNRGTIGSLNLDTVVEEGTWYQPWLSLATSASNYPVEAPGQLEVRTLLAETGTRSQEFYPDDMSLGAWRRVAQESVWTAWSQIGGATGSDAATGAMVRRDRARSRKGGRIGTGGRGVVTLRFDDAHDAMAATVMPLLRQYQLPAYQAVTVRNVEENSSRSWAQIQALVADGVEVFGHSWTHQAATGQAAIHKEVIESAAYMEAQMPGIAIEGWVMPGTGQSGTEAYDGFGPGGSVEAFTDTYAGRMILSRYAVPCGSIQGHLMPLNGAPVTGQVHWTFESATLADTQAMVRQAQATGTGITLMAHPSRFGEAGFMSVADLTSLLSWLASERDAERLLVLTGTGQAFADSSTSERMNVAPALEASAYPGSGWTFSSGVASSEGSGLLTYAAASVGVNHLRGGVLELSALVNAPTGGVLRTQVSGGAARTEDHTIPSGSGWRWVRMLVHYPTTAGVSAGLTINIRRTSGGVVNMANLALQPV